MLYTHVIAPSCNICTGVKPTDADSHIEGGELTPKA
jgi:hypothetical protein